MKLRVRSGLTFAALLSLLAVLPGLAADTPPAAGIEPARPLTPRGLDNLVAFTRLLGYIRFFHPSDQAAAADFDRLAIPGVQIAEKATGPEELARSLEDFFRPVAPTVRVYPTAGPKPGPPSLKGEEAVYWEHLGVKLGISLRSTAASGSAPGRARLPGEAVRFSSSTDLPTGASGSWSARRPAPRSRDRTRRSSR